ncbi:MAG: glycosyltransferase family 1 protein, partial [Planctomycetota bacterium]|nr:glycosyltransferase family 1 protein [Planctomycetota bacterium]
AGGAAKLFDPDDVELIANLIEQLDSDQHLFDKMRAAGLERSKAFSWQKCANETFSSYRKAIALTK